jgi:hypothetical protein
MIKIKRKKRFWIIEKGMGKAAKGELIHFQNTRIQFVLKIDF